MKIWIWISAKPVRALVGVLIMMIITPLILVACIPERATQTVATPAPPLTNLNSISPSRPKEPTATPANTSGPSVSPTADAVIPSPSGPSSPSPSFSPKPQPSASAASTSSPQAKPTSSPAASPSASPSQSASPSPSASPPSVNIDLTSQNMAFDKKTITVPAGAQVTVNYNNKDGGVYNGFSVYVDQTAQQPVFVGDGIIGPGNTTYSFSAPVQKGTYFFRSDNHPNSMTGQFIVQ